MEPIGDDPQVDFFNENNMFWTGFIETCTTVMYQKSASRRADNKCPAIFLGISEPIAPCAALRTPSTNVHMVEDISFVRQRLGFP